ncbi:MAG: hypothetical protein ACD_16C00126G0005 [uncultured bacterium]|nr:MAG: hypothetical protein ACD_16C00126G0005 [uncultured bacterium]
MWRWIAFSFIAFVFLGNISSAANLKPRHSIDSPKQAYAAMNDQVDWVKKYIEPY